MIERRVRVNDTVSSSSSLRLLVCERVTFVAVEVKFCVVVQDSAGIENVVVTVGLGDAVSDWFWLMDSEGVAVSVLA